MKKIAVTGGAGFIGSNLTQRLLSMGHKVKVIDDLSTGLISNVDLGKVEFHKISVTNFNDLHEALHDCDVVFHLAARGSVPRSIKNPMATHQVNTLGTINVLEVARETRAHILISSSSSVYGRNTTLPKTESMWLGPLTPYAASKLGAEAFAQAYASTYDLPVTTLRFFNVFGPKQRPDHEYAAVLPKWIWLAMQGKPIEVFGDGNTSRDFTYVDTVLDVAINAMEEEITPEGVVNVAYGNKVLLSQVILILQDFFPDLQVVYRDNRSGDVRDSQNDPSLLKSLFPSVVPKPFETAIVETISWIKEFGNSVANGPTLLD